MLALHCPALVTEPRFPSQALASPPRAVPGDALDRLLFERFRLASFRPWQREAIDALLAPPGRVMLVAPTGGGKSLCYQLPALALGGTTLVLSPLISLMEDQVHALDARGIPATFIASSLPREENGRRLAGLRRGQYKLVYAAPERLAFDGFLDALRASQLALVAIDEAHCIVQWGHDFRPDYLRIGDALKTLEPPRVLACTATATPDARAEIQKQLGAYGRDAKVVLRGFARPNLHLAAREVGGMSDAKCLTAEAIERALGSASKPEGAAIVYTATRKNTERVAAELSEQGFSAFAYHAGLDASTRARISSEFAERELSIVVATNAFGMGIDRSDVRAVVHVQPPGSIEAYYQEVGRAGRDGAPADGLLLIAPADIALRRRMSMSGPDGVAATPSEAARAWALFREVLRYVDAGTCRHDFILRYFGDEAESLGGCGHCDVCIGVDSASLADPDAIARDADVVRRMLAGVARAKGGAGMQSVLGMLRGERGERVAHLGLDKLSTFGILPERSQDELNAIARVLLAAGWVDLSGAEFPVPVVTDAGWRVMRSELPCQVRLPVVRKRGRAATGSAATRSPKLRRAAVVSSARGGGGELFEALRSHRAAIAKERAVPAYVVATNRTLDEIATLKPTTAIELEAAYGMGPSRIAAYGEGFLRVVREFV